MINKYKELYGEVIAELTQLHNAHLDYLEGPNMRKSANLKKSIKRLIPKLKALGKLTTTINREVSNRQTGSPVSIPVDPSLLTDEFNTWVGKGLGRVKKYTPK